MIPRSPGLRAAFFFGLSGVGFAGANLVMARLLSRAEFGRLTLFVALCLLVSQIGPLGIDGFINRHRPTPTTQALFRSFGTSVAAALAAVVAGSVAYYLDTPSLVALALAGVGTSLTVVAASYYQSRQIFGMSFVLSESFNLAFLASAVGIATWISSRLAIQWFLTFTTLGVAVVGWSSLHRHAERWGRHMTAFHWSEALAFLGVRGVGAILIMADRLVIPRALSFEELATFGVLSSIAGAPFRVMASGIGLTLLPRVRNATSVSKSHRVIKNEILVFTAVALLSTATLFGLTKPLVELLYGDKFRISTLLVVAMLVSGNLKVASALSVMSASALTSSEELRTMSALGWGAVLVAAICGFYGSRWGLPGVILGVSVGWLARIAIAIFFCTRRR